MCRSGFLALPSQAASFELALFLHFSVLSVVQANSASSWILRAPDRPGLAFSGLTALPSPSPITLPPLDCDDNKKAFGLTFFFTTVLAPGHGELRILTLSGNYSRAQTISARSSRDLAPRRAIVGGSTSGRRIAIQSLGQRRARAQR